MQGMFVPTLQGAVRSAVEVGSMALSLRARCRRRAVRSGVEHAARRRRGSRWSPSAIIRSPRRSMGINTALYKTTTFGISAMYTGIAGGTGRAGDAVRLAGQFFRTAFAQPSGFFFFFFGSVIGGVRSMGGAVFGAIFIQFVPNIAEHISKAATTAVYGVLLIAFMYLMPTGIAGLWGKRNMRIVKRQWRKGSCATRGRIGARLCLAIGVRDRQ